MCDVSVFWCQKDVASHVCVAKLVVVGDICKQNGEIVLLYLSNSMRKIVRMAFPGASRVIDRFYIQNLACDAVQ